MNRLCMCFFFFFKQKTAYEMRISDWSSDVCSSDLRAQVRRGGCADLSGAGPDAAPLWLADRGVHAGLLQHQAVSANHRQRHKAMGERCHRQSGGRSEERRVGKECGSTCRSGGAPYHDKKKKPDNQVENTETQ